MRHLPEQRELPDALKAANLFLGAHNHTQFAQFERNANVYLGLRYSF